jgi:hypothetical protein
MRPITVFRPFAEEIQAVISVTDWNEKKDQEVPLLVTLGKNYRSLIGRFLTSRTSASVATASGTAAAATQSQEDCDFDNSRTVSALLWRPDDWLCD